MTSHFGPSCPVLSGAIVPARRSKSFRMDPGGFHALSGRGRSAPTAERNRVSLDTSFLPFLTLPFFPSVTKTWNSRESIVDRCNSIADLTASHQLKHRNSREDLRPLSGQLIINATQNRWHHYRNHSCKIPWSILDRPHEKRSASTGRY